MGLKDLDKIDMILDMTPHAKVTLVLVDGETWPDEESRLKQYLIKLECYIAYVMSDQFKKDHPGVRPDQVLIVGMCQYPPTEAMKMVTHVRSKANPEVRIRVRCGHYQPGGELPWFLRPDGIGPSN